MIPPRGLGHYTASETIRIHSTEKTGVERRFLIDENSYKVVREKKHSESSLAQVSLFYNRQGYPLVGASAGYYNKHMH